jgi:genome maintenance exonuclease 1
MKWNKKFIYPASSRSLILDERHYELGTEGNTEKLPSVTTILAATQTDEKRAALEAWKARVGVDEATRTKDQAAERGTAMHKILESYIMGQNHLDLTDIGQNAHTMAQQIIDNGLKDLEEIWGSEVTIHYPGLYAGATDLAGIYRGSESIIDFKQSNKPKRKEWITDYFLQLAAYAMGHNYVYDTKIDRGVVLMCTKDNLFQRFEVEGREFVNYQHEFLRRVDQYYKNKV